MKKKLLQHKVITLLALFLTLWAGKVDAADVDITLQTNKSTFILDEAGTSATAEKDGVKFVYSKAESTTDIKGGLADAHLRVYKNATLTISSAKAIKKITLNAVLNNKIGADGFTAEGYSAAEDQKSGTWTGNATEVTLTASGGQVRITDITVTIDDAEMKVAAPTITGTTPFAGSTEITLACETGGASIYYTTDGTEPTKESTPYTAPFTIEATTTIKAIAVKGEDVSSVKTATFVAIASVATVAELNALEKDVDFVFTGEAVVVANPNGKHIFIKDASGSNLIYVAAGGITLETGSHITPNWTGKVAIYNGLFEAVPTSELTVVEGKTDEIKYETAKAEDITAANINKIVVLKGITYTVPDEKKNFTIKMGETEIAGYNQFGLTIDAPTEGETYNIVGAIGIYKENVQLQPLTITRTPKVISVTVDAETGTDLTALINAQKEDIVKDGNLAGDITINLATEGKYTVSGTIEAPAGIVINGNGATVDASAITAPFITMSKTPSVETISDYYRVGCVKISNVNINGIKNSIFYDNNTKYCVVDFTIDNSVLALATEAVENEALISFKAGGAKDVNITNSTFYGNNAVVKYFIRYNNSARLDRYGFDKDTEFQTMNYQNNTFHGLLKADGQWGNYNGISGQNYSKFDVKNNIWYNCGKDIIRRMAGGRFGGNSPLEFANNTYFNDGTDMSANESGYDKSGTILVTNPTFADTANADFHVFCGSQQAKEKTGDPRWLVEYDAAQALPIDITIAPAADTDIAAELATAKASVDKVGNITINLTKDAAYKIGTSLETAGNLVINGNGATVDASANAATLISLTDGYTVEGSDYKRINNVKIDNVAVKGVKNSLLYDNNVKICLVDLTINNSIVEFATEEVQNEALISFKNGGAKDVNITNSTFYGNNAVAKYFIRYNNSARLDRYGFDKDTEFQTMNYQNNTFHSLLKTDGQWGNYNGISGQNYSKFDVKNNIWYNCGKDIIRRMAGGRFGGNSPLKFANNTYFNDGTDMSANEAGYDKSGTILVTNPTFTDAANGDFHIGASTQQAKEKTGDPRWLVDFVAENVADAKALLKTEIETATKLLGDADIETSEAAKTLKNAIDKAQGVYDTAEFNEIINAATNELKAAEEAYKATGISEITSGADADNGAWYNMQGVKIEKPAQKGVYIHNGKKIVVR